MHHSGGGHIVNISSLAATHGKPGYTAYTPSKAAVNALTFTLAAGGGDSASMSSPSPRQSWSRRSTANRSRITPASQ